MPRTKVQTQLPRRRVQTQVAAALDLPRRQRGSGRPPKSDGEKTKARILEAARISFGDHGYEATSNRKVAEAARLTPGTIYHYFENKRDMFLTVQEETQKDILEVVNSAVEPATTFVQAVEKLLDAFEDLFNRHPEYARFNAVVRMEARRHPEIGAARADQEWRRLYHRMSDLAVATGEVDHREARRVRNTLSAIVLGITQHSMEASADDHRDCLQGFRRLFSAQLTRPAKRALRIAK